MEKWVLSFNDIDHQNELLYGYETIEGKNAKDALQKRFGKNFKRLTKEEGRCANVILIKGYFENNTIHCTSNGARLCFGIVQ